jgi:ribosomal protein S18 acetylase RimI-like enzyme
MDNLQILRAKTQDSTVLAEISKRSFHSDVICGGVGEGGPPGYDSTQWQSMIMKKSDYYKVMMEGTIIGGIIIFHKEAGHYYLGRIFLDPEFHRKGIGTKVMQLIINQYPFAKKWTLETPPWNTRTREFYKKQGFVVVGENNEDLFFEKVMKI